MDWRHDQCAVRVPHACGDEPSARVTQADPRHGVPHACGDEPSWQLRGSYQV